MKKKRSPSRRANLYRGLEDAIKRFYAVCSNCQKKLEVHAWGNKTHKRKEIIYCHCGRPGCPESGKEVFFNITA